MEMKRNENENERHRFLSSISLKYITDILVSTGAGRFSGEIFPLELKGKLECSSIPRYAIRKLRFCNQVLSQSPASG
jgi:hypothetical protein